MSMPMAVCGGTEPLRIGDVCIPCYVLEDERRIITAEGMETSLLVGDSTNLANVMVAVAIDRAAGDDLASRFSEPIQFVSKDGELIEGYEASLLADVCDAVLEARKAGQLDSQFDDMANAAEVLVRGFARVGIVALVDEATGYQQYRRRRALGELLDRYLADKLNPWTKTFPDEYYEHLFRLKGWDYSTLKAGDTKPAEVGVLTREVVYRRLAPGIVAELEARNPVIAPGKRRQKHHQWLTSDVGHPVLRNHLATVIAAMKLSRDWLEFERNLDKVAPLLHTQLYLEEFDD